MTKQDRVNSVDERVTSISTENRIDVRISETEQGIHDEMGEVLKKLIEKKLITLPNNGYYGYLGDKTFPATSGRILCVLVLKLPIKNQILPCEEETLPTMRSIGSQHHGILSQNT